LDIQQKSSKRPQLRKIKFKIPTLDDAIEEIMYIKKDQLKQNTSGFLIEIKSTEEYHNSDERDDILVAKIT
jgi:hypothetical protein